MPPQYVLRHRVCVLFMIIDRRAWWSSGVRRLGGLNPSRTLGYTFGGELFNFTASAPMLSIEDGRVITLIHLFILSLTCILIHLRWFIYSFIDLYIDSFTLIHLFIYWPAYWFIHSLTYILIHSRWFIYSFIDLYIDSFMVPCKSSWWSPVDNCVRC